MGRVGVLVLVVVAAAVTAAVALAAQSPKQLRAAMQRAASARHSVHYVSTSSIPANKVRIVSDVGAGQGVQHITFKSDGRSGPATILVVGHSAYLQGNAFTLHGYFGFTQAQAAHYAGTWISIPSTSPAYSDLAADATFASFLADLLPRKHLEVVRATIARRKAVGVSGTSKEGGLLLVETVYAPVHGRPLPFEEKVVTQGHGTGLTRMSRWSEPVLVTAPANAVPITTVVGQ